MSKAFRLKEFSKYPVITITGLLAIALTIAWWSKADVSVFFSNAEIRRGELWRLISPIFLHIDPFHLVFNLYWLWVFGTCIERAFGHRNAALLLLLFAIGSSAWQFALSQGGVGLSGVIYGLFGMLWILARHDERFRDVLVRNTVILFLAWFATCIAISLGVASLLIAGGEKAELLIVLLLGVMTFFPTLRKRYGYIVAIVFSLSVSAIAVSSKGGSIGNIAHGTGLILGMLTGFALSAPKWSKTIRSGIAIIILFGILGATLGRPLLNHSKYAGYEERKWCYDALKTDQNDKAIWWCRDAALFDMDSYDNLINLGIAFNRAGDKTRAKFFFHEARGIDPKRYDSEFKEDK
jgi:membrane associated rhomboid family serine protease